MLQEHHIQEDNDEVRKPTHNMGLKEMAGLVVIQHFYSQ